MDFESHKLQLLAMRPDALHVHFDLGMRSWEAGDLYGVARHRSAIGLLPEGGMGATEFMLLRWRELWLEGEQDAAAEVAQMAVERFPRDVDTLLDLCFLLGRMERHADALEVLVDAVEEHPDDADLWYELAKCASALEQFDERKIAFRRVWELEQDSEPEVRLFVSEETFEELANAALGSLPPNIQQALGHVSVSVEDYPSEAILDSDVADPRVLCFFAGAERFGEQAGSDVVADTPSMLHLYRWNLERTCYSEDDLEVQIHQVVADEVCHYLGLEDGDLAFAGMG